MTYTVPRLDTNWTPVRMPDGPQRDNLVIIRTSSSSEHIRWPKGTDRSFDILLSHYAASEPDDKDADIIVRQGAFKFAACYRLFRDIPWLNQYRAVWFCDDDVTTGWADIDRMFEVFHAYDLDLAHPSVTRDSSCPHRIIFQRIGQILRYTNFIDIMAPIISGRVLGQCLPTFACSVTGWGLNPTWAHLLGYPHRKIAVIDHVSVGHLRPVGAGNLYIEAGAFKIDPFEEARIMMEVYGVSEPIKRELGNVACFDRWNEHLAAG